MSKRVMAAVLVVVVLAAMPLIVSAQDAGSIVKTGSLVADTGGATNSWVIEVPDGGQVDFYLKQTNFPCLPGPHDRQKDTPDLGAFGLKVSEWGLVDYSTEVGSRGCYQELHYNHNNGGGPVTVEVYNNYEGSVADYELTIEGAIVTATESMTPTVAGEAVVPAAEPKTGRAE